MPNYSITPQNLTFDAISNVLNSDYKLKLSSESKALIVKGRNYLDNKLRSEKQPVYGINTGFGALYRSSIPGQDLETLQHNLVRSHACGTGDKVPAAVVKLMLLLKIHALSKGHSGVQVDTVNRLIDFFNNGFLPVVYQQGSLGASGDLAPLAHLSLPLFGEGEFEIFSEQSVVPAKNVLSKMGWKPLHLKSKEGLALLNGTQFMSAYGTSLVISAFEIASYADLIACISLDAFDGRPEPFDSLIQSIRNHQGQKDCADNIRQLLKGSEIIKRKKEHVQDPYSFRCIPQVHGASRDTITYVASVLQDEINAVTDNPLLFPDEDKILSGGNFHGQPVALALDFLAIALAELGSISERRTYLLISGQRSLPPFLVKEPGLNSGFMIPQYTAASIVSQNKQLCTPASVDSIVSSNGQEDHVSMGANAATKAYRVMENLKTILAIELMTACQALEFRKPLKSSTTIEKFAGSYRNVVPFLEKDRTLYTDITATREFLFGN